MVLKRKVSEHEVWGHQVLRLDDPLELAHIGKFQELRDLLTGEGKPQTVMHIRYPSQVAQIIADPINGINVHNRDFMKNTLEKLQRDLENDEFVLIHQGIAFDGDGFLMDGQHRLISAGKKNKDIELMTTFNLPLSRKKAIDRHAPRKLRDIMVMRGITFKLAHESALNFLLHCWGMPFNRMTASQLFDYYFQIEDQMQYWVNLYSSYPKQKGVRTIPVLGAFIRADLEGYDRDGLTLLFHSFQELEGICVDSKLIKNFIKGLLSGVVRGESERHHLCCLLEKIIVMYFEDEDRLRKRVSFGKNDYFVHHIEPTDPVKFPEHYES